MSSHSTVSRRSFLASAALAPLTGALARKKPSPVGLELYSVRTELSKDLPGTVRAVAKQGYQVVEFYGPYYSWTLGPGQGDPQAAGRSGHPLQLDPQRRAAT